MKHCFNPIIDFSDSIHYIIKRTTNTVLVRKIPYIVTETNYHNFLTNINIPLGYRLMTRDEWFEFNELRKLSYEIGVFYLLNNYYKLRFVNSTMISFSVGNDVGPLKTYLVKL